MRWDYVPSRNEVVLHCVGRDAAVAIMPHALQIQSALGALGFTASPEVMAVTSSDTLVPLVFRRLVVTKTKEKASSAPWTLRHLGGAEKRVTLEGLRELCTPAQIEARVAHIIEREARRLARTAGIGESGFPEPVIIGRVELDSVNVIPLGGGGVAVVAVSGQALANFKLTGTWHLGRGASFGAGRTFTRYEGRSVSK